MNLRRCTGPCGQEYPEEAFFRRRVLNASSTRGRYHPKCIGCETTERTEEKERDRTGIKARDTIRRHAQRLHVDVATLSDRYGWRPDRIKHDIEHASKNGCGYCRRLFSSMGHGLADITIDVIDPKKEPYYTTNTKIVCQTCNREKARTAPEVWACKLICWDRWEQRQQYKERHPMCGLPLWDAILGLPM